MTKNTVRLVVLFTVFLVGFLLGTSKDAWSQEAKCTPLRIIEDALLNEFGETRKYQARMDTPDGVGTPFFTYVNPESRTWTFIMIVPNTEEELFGCVMGAGDKWTELVQKSGKEL